MAELHELYGWTFEAFRARGIAEAEAEVSEPKHLGTSARPRTAPPRRPRPARTRSSSSAHPGRARASSPGRSRSTATSGPRPSPTSSTTCSRTITWRAPTRRPLPARTAPGCATTASTSKLFLAHLGLGLNVLLTGTSDGRRWIDQTPANTLVVDRLAEMFPGARFLHILRDGRRVVHSMINFHRAMGDPEAVERMRDAGRLPPWTTDFADACRTWARFVRIAADFSRRNPERTHTLTNERLITDPDEAMRGRARLPRRASGAGPRTLSAREPDQLELRRLGQIGAGAARALRAVAGVAAGAAGDVPRECRRDDDRMRARHRGRAARRRGLDRTAGPGTAPAGAQR